MDQYEHVHEVKALPQHPYSPATHTLGLGSIPQAEQAGRDRQGLHSKAHTSQSTVHKRFLQNVIQHP